MAVRVPQLLDTMQGDMYQAARNKYDSCVEKVSNRAAVFPLGV